MSAVIQGCYSTTTYVVNLHDYAHSELSKKVFSDLALHSRCCMKNKRTDLLWYILLVQHNVDVVGGQDNGGFLAILEESDEDASIYGAKVEMSGGCQCACKNDQKQHTATVKYIHGITAIAGSMRRRVVKMARVSNPQAVTSSLPEPQHDASCIIRDTSNHHQNLNV